MKHVFWLLFFPTLLGSCKKESPVMKDYEYNVACNDCDVRFLNNKGDTIKRIFTSDTGETNSHYFSEKFESGKPMFLEVTHKPTFQKFSIIMACIKLPGSGPNEFFEKVIKDPKVQNTVSARFVTP